jgi:hypothetical protein
MRGTVAAVQAEIRALQAAVPDPVLIVSVDTSPMKSKAPFPPPPKRHPS